MKPSKKLLSALGKVSRVDLLWMLDFVAHRRQWAGGMGGPRTVCNACESVIYTHEGHADGCPVRTAVDLAKALRK